MSPRIDKPEYTFGEEIANCITHGIGILLAIGGLVVMLRYAAHYGSSRHLVACGIFGATLILAYLSSTLYHGVPRPEVKRILQVLDHTSIYLLIAGTYTPFTLISLHGPWGWSLFGIIWGVALLGILCRLLIPKRLASFSTLLYLAMGWVVVIAARPLLAHVPPGGLWLLLAGGLAYSGGVLFYRLDRMPYNHMVWHLFVLAGSCLHFFSIFFYVLPGRSLS